jgi:hypothetical protein
MAKHEVIQTIHSDEFRIELQPVTKGPRLVLSGSRHDSEMNMTVYGVEGTDDQQRDVAQMTVTLAHLVMLVESAKKARVG